MKQYFTIFSENTYTKDFELYKYLIDLELLINIGLTKFLKQFSYS